MIVSGWRWRGVQSRMWGSVARVSMRRYRDPVRATAAIQELAGVRKHARGRPVPRGVSAGGRHFTHLYTPGWPSPAFDRFIENEFARIEDARAPLTAPARPRLQNVIMAITRQCPLRCEHCCEGDVLNHDDVIGVDEHVRMVGRFQSLGVTQIQFSGGEPLTQAAEIARIMSGAQPGTDFWMLSSGIGLSSTRAHELKRAGLTGVCVSLDHWDETEHNRFRGSSHSYKWVERAASSAHEAGLVLTLSLCPTRNFVTRENLFRYLGLASRVGAGFIQLFEPRAVGNFAGQDVELRPHEQRVLEQFFEEVNFGAAHRFSPIVVYQELARRRDGCVGAGVRYVYVNTAGELYPCPFCRHGSGHVLAPDMEEQIACMAAQGCPTTSCKMEAISEAAGG